MNSVNTALTQTDGVAHHPAFELLRNVPIDTLKVRVEEYRHRVTGAQHVHIASDNPENVFLVALRTVPEDSTGVAHILEHTALCGSEKYPVRDPFFMMTRRSLNTFMNAFTSSDWTAYPFASQNRKDYFNLLDVYLDAVFFSRLDALDFAQEGHRLEFKNAADASSPLTYKGVVYNEMKGAMSAVTSTLWQTLTRHLFPYNTYHFNSGGDPEHIPDLSYEQLKEFYRTHYQPGNAVFMTYGDIPAAELQGRFEEQALKRFDPMPIHIAVPLEKRYHAPVRIEECYAWEEEAEPVNKTHIVIGWLLGQSTSLADVMRAHLLSGILLDNSASPLLKALETTELGSAPSPLCGLEDSQRELVFACGIEGSEAAHADAVETLVMSTLLDVAENGVPIEQVRSVLHQLELSQREIGGDGYPYGLQLIFMAMSGAVHRGDPVAVMDIEPVLAQLQQDIEDPDFIKSLARTLLVDNPHRVRLVLSPDTRLSKRREQAEEARLASIRAALDDEQIRLIVDTAAELERRQNEVPDGGCLPELSIADVPAAAAHPEPIATRVADLPATVFRQGTNGIVYQQLVVDMPQLDESEVALLPYYTGFLTELGLGDADYLHAQMTQAAVTGGIGCYASIRAQVDNEQLTQGALVLGSSALARNVEAMSGLLRETFETIRFDERQRICELVSQKRARRDQSITGSGHSLAMMAASSQLSPVAWVQHRQSGLEGIRHTRALDKALKDERALNQLTIELAQLHQKFLNSRSQILLIGDESNLPAAQDAINTAWSGFEFGVTGNGLALPERRQQTRQIWQTSTQVHFCAKAYPSVPSGHRDAAALTVLGGFLRNGFLHRAIREQGGAYGGGASQDSANASFRFYSYRDPNHTATLDAFDQSIDWFLGKDHPWQQVEEAILGVISSLDKPGSPAGEAKRHFHDCLFGRTPERKREFRERVLSVTAEDMVRVASDYLCRDQASIAVITNAGGASALKAYAPLAGADIEML